MSTFIEYKQDEIKKCRINLFDDGNQVLENKYENIWLIIATNNKGKVRLQNVKDPNFILYSISLWKVQIIDEIDNIIYSLFNVK